MPVIRAVLAGTGIAEGVVALNGAGVIGRINFRKAIGIAAPALLTVVSSDGTELALGEVGLGLMQLRGRAVHLVAKAPRC